MIFTPASPSSSLYESPHQNQKEARILVFDSGIGGLGFVQALQHHLPRLPLDYLADTEFFPYGEKEDALLTERILALITEANRLLSPILIVIACNTASTLALAPLREKLLTPLVGCVPPIRWAARLSKTRHIGLLTTSATARRPYLHQLHQEFASDCQLLIHGGRALADLAEKSFYGREIPQNDIEREIHHLLSQQNGEKIDMIGLGCTHYSFLMPYFEKLDLPHITWLDPAPAVAQQAMKKLQETPKWADHFFREDSKQPLSNSSLKAKISGNRFFTTAPFKEECEKESLVRLEKPLEKMGFTEKRIFPFSANTP